MEPKGIWQSILSMEEMGRPVSQLFSIVVEAQTAYDAAVRAVNNADRQLNDSSVKWWPLIRQAMKKPDAKSLRRPSEQSILRLRIYEMLFGCGR